MAKRGRTEKLTYEKKMLLVELHKEFKRVIKAENDRIHNKGVSRVARRAKLQK